MVENLAKMGESITERALLSRRIHSFEGLVTEKTKSGDKLDKALLKTLVEIFPEVEGSVNFHASNTSESSSIDESQLEEKLEKFTKAFILSITKGETDVRKIVLSAFAENFSELRYFFNQSFAERRPETIEDPEN